MAAPKYKSTGGQAYVSFGTAINIPYPATDNDDFLVLYVMFAVRSMHWGGDIGLSGWTLKASYTGQNYTYGNYETYMFIKRATGGESGNQYVPSNGTSGTSIYGIIYSYSDVDWTTTYMKDISQNDPGINYPHTISSFGLPAKIKEQYAQELSVAGGYARPGSFSGFNNYTLDYAPSRMFAASNNLLDYYNYGDTITQDTAYSVIFYFTLIGTDDINIPKFVVGDDEIFLQHTNTNKIMFNSNEIEHKSIFTGYKSYAKCADYIGFQILLYLYKYDDPKAKFQEIYEYNHATNVVFYLDGTEEPLRDPFGQDQQYIIKEIEPFYLTQLVNYDALLITFEPINTSRYQFNDWEHEGYGKSYAVRYGPAL